jgi:hypothetical protein
LKLESSENNKAASLSRPKEAFSLIVPAAYKLIDLKIHTNIFDFQQNFRPRNKALRLRALLTSAVLRRMHL